MKKILPSFSFLFIAFLNVFSQLIPPSDLSGAELRIWLGSKRYSEKYTTLGYKNEFFAGHTTKDILYAHRSYSLNRECTNRIKKDKSWKFCVFGLFDFNDPKKNCYRGDPGNKDWLLSSKINFQGNEKVFDYFLYKHKVLISSSYSHFSLKHFFLELPHTPYKYPVSLAIDGTVLRHNNLPFGSLQEVKKKSNSGFPQSLNYCTGSVRGIFKNVSEINTENKIILHFGAVKLVNVVFLNPIGQQKAMNYTDTQFDLLSSICVSGGEYLKCKVMPEANQPCGSKMEDEEHTIVYPSLTSNHIKVILEESIEQLTKHSLMQPLCLVGYSSNGVNTS